MKKYRRLSRNDRDEIAVLINRRWFIRKITLWLRVIKHRQALVPPAIEETLRRLNRVPGWRGLAIELIVVSALGPGAYEARLSKENWEKMKTFRDRVLSAT